MSRLGSESPDPGATRGSRRLLALSVLALLVVVALSVRAHYSLGPSGVPNRGLGAALLGSTFQVLLVVIVAAFELILVLALGYAPWRRLREAGQRGAQVPRMSRRLVLRLVAIPVLVLLAQGATFFWLLEHRVRRVGSAHAGGGPLALPRQHFVSKVGAVTVPEATALAAAVGLVALLVIVVGRLRSRRAPAGEEAESPELPQDLTSAIDQSLAELAAGTDPRQAVIAAYERMERVLAGVGLPALAFETPLEYLERVLTRLEASRGALVRLTDLFETARFSARSVGPQMRAEAETALVGLRAELSG